MQKLGKNMEKIWEIIKKRKKYGKTVDKIKKYDILCVCLPENIHVKH